MPAISTVVLADATPSNHTLYPLSASIASSKFAARDASIQKGNRTLELKNSFANGSRPTDRVTVLYASPQVVQVDGVDTVVDILRFSGEFTLAETVGDTARDHFIEEVKNLMAHALIEACCKRDPPY